MPSVVTLDDLTAMMGADEHHRYEVSPEGALSILPPPGSEGIDTVTKRGEYATAGIPQYWVVDQDTAQTVTMHVLADGHYTARATMPLAWVLNSTPSEHDLS